MKEKLFVFIIAEEGPMFLNLSQVVRTTGLRPGASDEDTITLHTSDGISVTLHGDLVPQILARMAEMTVLPDGSDFRTLLAKS
jgi:hypothetical protein